MQSTDTWGDFPNNTKTLFSFLPNYVGICTIANTMSKNAGMLAQTKAVVPECPCHCSPHSLPGSLNTLLDKTITFIKF